MLRDEGRLELDDRVDMHLPELGKVRLAPNDARPITLRQVLTHTSGLARLGSFDYTLPDRDVTEAEMLAALDTTVARPPGTEYLYSNFAMSLAGLVVARASGTTYRDFLHEKVFLPLGMTKTAFNPPKDAPVATGYTTNDSDTPAAPWRLGASESSGGLYASLDDMAKWVGFQEEAWPARDGDDVGPLRRASVRESHMGGVPADFSAEKVADGLRVNAESVGLAWHVRRTCDFASLVEHGGAIDGFHANVAFAPDRGFGLVVLSNSIAAGTSRISEAILALIVQRRALAPRVPVFSRTALVEQWLASYGDPSATAYEAVFSPAFREHVPLAKMREVGVRLSKRHGSCKLSPNDTIASSAVEASFRATCEKGALRLHAFVADGAFGGFTVESSGFPPSTRLKRAATEALALLPRWDEARAKKLFTKDTKLEVVRKALADQSAQGGTCTLGAGEGDSEDDATFPLRCQKGRPMELSVGLQKDERVSTLTLIPRPGTVPRCH